MVIWLVETVEIIVSSIMVFVYITGVKDVHDHHPKGNIFPNPVKLQQNFGSLSDIRKLKFRQ